MVDAAQKALRRKLYIIKQSGDKKSVRAPKYIGIILMYFTLKFPVSQLWPNITMQCSTAQLYLHAKYIIYISEFGCEKTKDGQIILLLHIAQIVHSYIRTSKRQVQKQFFSVFSPCVCGTDVGLLVDRLRLDWLLSAAQCGEKIYCGCTCDPPSLRQRVAHYSSHCPYSHQDLQCLQSVQAPPVILCMEHGGQRLEGFDTGFQTGFIIYAMI